MPDSVKHPDQMNEFERDNEWQGRMRDYILVPEFYETRWPGNYELIKYGDPRAAGGCDTICNGKRIDEKIVRWPNRPEGRYTAYALETMSCTIPGRERVGWMRTNDVDYLLYCFADAYEEALDCHVINFVELKRWFELCEELHPLWISNQINQTHCRIVPFEAVAAAVSVRRYEAPRQTRVLPIADAEVFDGSLWSRK